MSFDLMPPEQAEAILALPEGERPRGDPATWSVTDTARTWCRRFSTPFAPISIGNIDFTTFRAHARHCQETGWLPTFSLDSLLVVVTPYPHSPSVRRAVTKRTYQEIHWLGCPEQDFAAVIAQLPTPDPPPDRYKLKAAAAAQLTRPALWRADKAVRDAYGRLLEEIILVGWAMNASDVRFEDDGRFITVRFIASDTAETMPPIPARDRSQFLHALKTRMGINQLSVGPVSNSRFSVGIPNSEMRLDIRAAFIPTIPPGGGTSSAGTYTHRILDNQLTRTTVVQLPFPPHILSIVARRLRLSNGLIIFTGPTGSGKTTTLYSCISTFDRSEKVIMSIEDPVEISMPGISQVQVAPENKITFASAIENFLRQKPNVILVGEIREPDTADQCVRASLTGHLVISTLHTNNARESILRLRNLRVDPENLEAVLSLIVAQRLLKRLCPTCRRAVPVPAEQASRFKDAGIPVPLEVFRRTGCAHCMFTGYLGATPIFEVLEFTPAVQAALRKSLEEMHSVWLSTGGRTLAMEALAAVADGRIDFETAEPHLVGI